MRKPRGNRACEMGYQMQILAQRSFRHPPVRVGVLSVMAALMLSACSSGNIDWDLRNNASDTSGAAEQATTARPTPDQNGVISYPGYQVIVARKGDTVSTLALRVGLSGDDLARFNALKATDNLREGEILALPTRVAAAAAGAGPTTGAIIGGSSSGVDVTSIATTALDRVDNSTGATPAAQVPFSTQTSGPVPVRYQVKRGETAFSIARTFNISAKALADWNGLGPDLAVREGQYLIIPTPSDAARLPSAAETADATLPGVGSPTPEPPSASQPLPAERTQTAAQVAKTLPVSPDLGNQRTAASASKFAMPLNGSIIRGYQKKVNDGIDISAAAGSPVRAAADGVVAAITKDQSGTPIIVVKHDGGLLTVYAGVDGVTVAQGTSVKRGQTIATVKAGSPSFLHFEVRQGLESVDPLPYLQ